MVMESSDRSPSAPALCAPTSHPKTLEQIDLTTSEASSVSAEQKQMESDWKAYLVRLRATSREWLTPFAERGEAARKKDRRPRPPPLEIAEYPDLLKRAWGWDRILPYHPRSSWSRYKKHLLEYYTRNAPSAHQMEADAPDDGSLNGYNAHALPALAKLCVEMEGELMILLKRRPQTFPLDEASLSGKITKCAHQMINVKSSEFPAASIALKCIMKEVDLMCDLVVSGIHSTSLMNVSSGIRHRALNFMTYKGDDYLIRAATMLGSMKEAELICEVLRKDCVDKNDDLSMSHFVRVRTLGAMARICFEHRAATESTIPAVTSIHESIDKSGLEVEPVKEVSRGEKSRTEVKNKRESLKGDRLMEMDKDERAKKLGSSGKRHTKHGSKLQDLFRENEDKEFDVESPLLNHSEQKESRSASRQRKPRSWKVGQFLGLMKRRGRISGPVLVAAQDII